MIRDVLKRIIEFTGRIFVGFAALAFLVGTRVEGVRSLLLFTVVVLWCVNPFLKEDGR